MALDEQTLRHAVLAVVETWIKPDLPCPEVASRMHLLDHRGIPDSAGIRIGVADVQTREDARDLLWNFVRAHAPVWGYVLTETVEPDTLCVEAGSGPCCVRVFYALRRDEDGWIIAAVWLPDAEVCPLPAASLMA